MNYLMRSIQNGVIECNKLLSRAITGSPAKYIESQSESSPKNTRQTPQISDGAPFIEGSNDPLGDTILL